MNPHGSKSDQIIQSAIEILTHEGAPGLSMRKVAERSNMSLGNLQYHFKTKETLLEALLEFFLNECRRQSSEFFAELTGSPEEKLKHLMRYGLENQQFAEWSGIFKELWAMAERNAPIKRNLGRYYREYFKAIVELLRSVSPKPDELKLHKAAAVLLTFLEGYSVTRDTLPITPAQMAEVVTELVLRQLHIDAQS